MDSPEEIQDDCTKCFMRPRIIDHETFFAKLVGEQERVHRIILTMGQTIEELKEENKTLCEKMQVCKHGCCVFR